MENLKRKRKFKNESEENKKQKINIENVDTSSIEQLDDIISIVSDIKKPKPTTQTTTVMYHTRNRTIDSKNSKLTKYAKSKEWIGQSGLKKIIESSFEEASKIYDGCYVMNTLKNNNSLAKLRLDDNDNVIVEVVGRFNEKTKKYEKYQEPVIFSTTSPIKSWTDSIHLKMSVTAGRNVSAGWSYTKPVSIIGNTVRRWNITMLQIKKKLISNEYPETGYVDFSGFTE